MAEGLAKKYAKDKFEIFSAGSKPVGFVRPKAIKVMKEIGIDISNQSPKGFSDLPYKEFDYVITMGCDVVCPFSLTKQEIEWEIKDPIGKPIEVFRNVRDTIEEKLARFFKKR